MNVRNRSMLITWLKDAHAMERALEKVLQRQADHAADDFELHRRIEEHIQTTRLQASRLETCLRRYDAPTSAIKDTMAWLTGLVQGIMTWTAPDTKVKDMLVGIAGERFEMACYHSLEAAAMELGDQRTAEIARQNFQEELEYCDFLQQRLSQVMVMTLREQVTTAS